MPDPLAFTIPQAITTAGVRKTSLYAAIKRGELRARKSGRRTLILRDDLRAWLERLPTLELKRPAPDLLTSRPLMRERKHSKSMNP
jgi:excisionase family DNA binding protein